MVQTEVFACLLPREEDRLELKTPEIVVLPEKRTSIEVCG